MKWIVQEYAGGRDHLWRDISSGLYSYRPELWEAEDAGAAFALAVINNPNRRIESTRYRVLLYDGGATFNVGINVDAAEHDDDEVQATPTED